MNRSWLKLAAIVATVGMLAVQRATAEIIAQWTFEESVPSTAGPHSAEDGVFAGIISPIEGHHNAASFYNHPFGNGSEESFSSDAWEPGDYYQFSTSTLGYFDISVAWDQTRSLTAPDTFDLYWSIDGQDFQLLMDDFLVEAVAWFNTGETNTQSHFGPVFAPESLNNQEVVYFRITADSNAQHPAGTGRLDNIRVEGLVPEPASICSLLFGFLAMRRTRSRIRGR